MNNIHNKLLYPEDVENIVNMFLLEKIKVNNISLYQKAFTHKSFCIIDPDNSDSDNYSVIKKIPTGFNERMEFLGDKVIDFITTEYLFDKYPEKDEGFLTKLKSKMVNKDSLSYLGTQLNFKNFILISTHIERISGRNNNSRLIEDIFESFMASLYLDQNRNMNICREFLINIYNKYINLESLIKNNTNFKDSLLRYFQSQGWKYPVYTLISCKENKQFITVVMIKNKILEHKQAEFRKKLETSCDITILPQDTILGIGKGTTKKISEQECSKNCLENLSVNINY